MEMLKLQAKHFLTGLELTKDEILSLINYSIYLKKIRNSQATFHPLKNKQLALIFEKPSLRTRMSFSVAMNELGGNTIESLSSTSKREEPQDVARVLSGYVHGVMWRTFDQKNLELMSQYSAIPIINGLSDLHHPCQALADFMTLKERFNCLGGLNLSYVGDGNNVLHSLMLIGSTLGVNINYSCPRGYEPNSLILQQAKRIAAQSGSQINSFHSPIEAVKGAHAVYTDVWISMGQEEQETERKEAFKGYQINSEIMSVATPNAIILHCLPMNREIEITSECADGPQSALFQQSENRLHVQKSLLVGLIA